MLQIWIKSTELDYAVSHTLRICQLIQLNHKIAAGVCCYLRMCLGHVNVLHFSHKSNHSVYSNYPLPCSLSLFAVQLNSVAILRASVESTFPHLMQQQHCTELFCVNIYDRQANQFEKLLTDLKCAYEIVLRKTYFILGGFFFIRTFFPFVIIFNGDVQCSRVGIFHIHFVQNA